jgi:hypothetical protein
MRSLIASLRTLTLPAGATSGARIVLDGVTGQIRLFDANDDLRLRLNPTGGILEISTGADNELLPGDIQASGQGSIGTTERYALTVESPKADNEERAILDLISESVDGTIPTKAEFFADTVEILDGGGGNTADLLLNGVSLPRGVLARDRATANVTFSTETQLAQADQVMLVSGRRYRLALSWRSVIWGTTAANVICQLRIKDLASTQRMEVGVLATGTTSREGGHMDVLLNCPGEIASGAHTFEATAERVTGIGTCIVEAAGTYPLTLTVEDVGATI